MTQASPDKLQPALFGGVFIGVLSALPLINVANCCCLWVIGGGVLATYLLQQNHPYAITSADGALVGLMAGVVGGILAALLSIPVSMAMGPYLQQMMEGVLNNPEFPPEVRDSLKNMPIATGFTVIGTMINVFIYAIIGGIFAMLGGLLGVALFKKKDAPPPPGSMEVLPPTV